MIFETIHSVTSDTKISQYQSQTIYGETIHLYLFLKLKAYWLLLLIYIIFKHCIQDVFLDFFFVWFFCGVIFIESNLVEQVPGEPHTVCEGATCPRKTLHRAPSPIFKHIFEWIYFIYLICEGAPCPRKSPIFPPMWSTSNIFCPTQKKAHKPQRCTGLNFYPETQQPSIPYLKRWVTWVCGVYPEVLRDAATV